MTFFDNKQDVLQIEITPHGRELLSKGKMKPVFYCFFDDDIIYESEFSGFSENNTQTKTRILEETPYLKTQNAHDGIDSNFKTLQTSLDYVRDQGLVNHDMQVKDLFT